MKGLCQAEGGLGGAFTFASLLLKKTYSVAKKKSGGDKQGQGLNHLDLCEAAWDPWLISMAAKHFNPMYNLQTHKTLGNLEKISWPLFSNPGDTVLQQVTLQRAWHNMG